jgi:hypothetical protein
VAIHDAWRLEDRDYLERKKPSSWSVGLQADEVLTEAAKGVGVDADPPS